MGATPFDELWSTIAICGPNRIGVRAQSASSEKITKSCRKVRDPPCRDRIRNLCFPTDEDGSESLAGFSRKPGRSKPHRGKVKISTPAMMAAEWEAHG